MKKDLIVFDFYGNGEYNTIFFESVELDGVPVKEYYELNRTGFNNSVTEEQNGNVSLNFPVNNIELMKFFYSKEDIELMEDFFIHYLVYPDLPLEFRIKISEIEYIRIHGFLEQIDFSQDTNSTIINMNMKLTSYSESL